MTRCATHLDEYLAVRRALGYKLERAREAAREFVAYLDERAES